MTRRHGTNSCYSGGCRCDPCVQGRAEYMRDLSRRHREAPNTIQVKSPPEHGTYSRYCNGPCRCRPCRDANAAMRRDWRKRIKAGAA